MVYVTVLKSSTYKKVVNRFDFYNWIFVICLNRASFNAVINFDCCDASQKVLPSHISNNNNGFQI